jgi:hypothetical protein
MDNLLAKLRDTKSQLENLDDAFKALSRLQTQLTDSQSNLDGLNRLRNAIDSGYHTTHHRLAELLQTIDAVVGQEHHPSTPSVDSSAPTLEDAKSQLVRFFQEPIRKKNAPLPPYTGCRAFRNMKDVSQGAFICANHRDSFMLMIVVKVESDVCAAVDPTAGDIQVVDLGKNDWTPLTTVIPEKPQKRWEHASGAEVLSLYPNGDEWTTEFYRAKVRVQPCERPDDEERGYLLDFGDGEKVSVPEKFVISVPDWWKELPQGVMV